MVSLEEAKKHNASLKDFLLNLVAAFGDDVLTWMAEVGGTSGIGEATAHGQISLIECDASRLRSVNQACKKIQQKETKVNLLFMTAGIMTTKGRDVAAKPSLGKILSRVVSVLSAGDKTPLIMDDLSLKKNFSLRNCGRHAITVASLSMEQLASAHPLTSFVHTSPSAVKMGLMRDFGPLTRAAIEAMYLIAKLSFVPLDESGERHLTLLRVPASRHGVPKMLPVPHIARME
ncbi:hypothetical protein N7532_012004 [Penicillium argentinense]|uniref:Uncharacterized protein n=1 Tax=Penicillium argentinense TaxID=1131581 RepID=A0A9W9EJR7_9EURO|nr:uncharacterized protein N7532_012004 [Penicillium argentinense]KAJ5082961.1 hypothetical protein N7532_012004 [Penicillium argentinense]